MRVFPGCVGWEERHGAASSTRVPTCLFFLLLLLLFLPPTAAVIIFSLEERLLPTCLPSLSASSSSFFLLLFLDVCFPIKTIKTNRLTRSNCFFVTHYTSGRFYTSRFLVPREVFLFPTGKPESFEDLISSSNEMTGPQNLHFSF